jgi:hypothetical protein
MNTYKKYAPNVFLAKCEEKHQKGDTITVETKRGKENECKVFNLIAEVNGYYFYSIVRADGFNAQEHAKKRAERIAGWAASAMKKSDAKWEESNEGRDFLSLAEPIKVGHHSEKRHRALFARNDARMSKSMELKDKAESYGSRIEYWEGRADIINASMPESIEYYEYELEKAKMEHEGLKDGTIERSHSFSLTYAKKEVNKFTKLLKLANQLWA